jgi:RNAse (barnase) inhibitor barstar
VKRIVLDAGSWSNLDAFYAALLPALGAPGWHGHNFNALWDSMAIGDINTLTPPYEIVLTNTAELEEPLRSDLVAFLALVKKARTEEGVEIFATAEPTL